jgi:nucleoside-diphosphate-sugar epimerase
MVDPGAGRLVLVTGAASFIGSHIVFQLLEAGYRGEAESSSKGLQLLL